MSYTLNFDVIWGDSDNLFGGLGLGLALALSSSSIGAVIGLVVRLCRARRSPACGGSAAGYVTVVRNTPLLVIVLFAYFALPRLGIRLGKLESFVVSLALYAGAYLTEVFRASLLGVPRGLIDAGLAIGLTRLQVARLIRSADHAAQRAAGARHRPSSRCSRTPRSRPPSRCRS